MGLQDRTGSQLVLDEHGLMPFSAFRLLYQIVQFIELGLFLQQAEM